MFCANVRLHGRAWRKTCSAICQNCSFTSPDISWLFCFPSAGISFHAVSSCGQRNHTAELAEVKSLATPIHSVCTFSWSGSSHVAWWAERLEVRAGCEQQTGNLNHSKIEMLRKIYTGRAGKMWNAARSTFVPTRNQGQMKWTLLQYLPKSLCPCTQPNAKMLQNIFPASGSSTGAWFPSVQAPIYFWECCCRGLLFVRSLCQCWHESSGVNCVQQVATLFISVGWSVPLLSFTNREVSTSKRTKSPPR